MTHLLLNNSHAIADERVKAIASHLISNPQPLDITTINELELYAKNWYVHQASQTFTRIIDTFTPHIMCLQEISSGEEHIDIKTLLNTRGYDIVQKNGLAIAYRRQNFQLLESEKTVSDETAALYVDVKVKGTNKIIRVVSDHLAGFNTRNHKNNKTLCKTSTIPSDSARALMARKTAPKIGDSSLEQNIAIVDRLKRSIWLPSCFGGQDAPDTIIYGLDANATARHITKQNRVHPKRLDQFVTHGFISDITDERPTIVDHSTSLPYKFDYLYCKSASSIIDHELPSINTPDMLGNPQLSMSDHLPVLATITVNS